MQCQSQDRLPSQRSCQDTTMEPVRAKVSVLIHKAYHKDTERSLSITDQLIRWASPSYLISFPWNKGTRLRQPKMFSCAFEGSTFSPFPFPLSFSREKMVKKEKKGVQGFPVKKGTQEPRAERVLRETKVKGVPKAHLEL